MAAVSCHVSVGPAIPFRKQRGSKFLRRRIQLRMLPARFSASAERSQGGAEGQDTPEKEDLAKKLAAAEAEAESLRRELALRKAEAQASELSDKPSGSKPKIDGIGYRETIFSGPRTSGKLAKNDGGARAWGFSEADLLQSEGGLMKLQQEYGTDADDNPIGKEEAEAIVQRRLLIGAAVAALGLGLAFVEIPTTLTKPSKPLNIYLVPVVRLKAALGTVKEQAEFLDALGLRAQLKLATGSLSAVKDNLLSTAALLDSSSQPEATKLAFQILDYLEQADYSKYFEGMGVPGPYQQAEFIKFSIQSLEVAQQKLSQFLALVPKEALSLAEAQLEGGGQVQ